MRILVFLMCVLLSCFSRADDEDSCVQLQINLAVLAARVNVLEQEVLRLNRRSNADALDSLAADPAQARHINSAGDRTRFDGDFRYRYEEINVQRYEVHQRSRIRARASIATDVSETIELGFGVATGGLSPVSSTQTLGNGGSKKDVALDLAYVDWTPFQGLHVLAGKFRNPLFQVLSQTLLWDDEWRPEGLALSYKSDSYFASILGAGLESDNFAARREWAVGGHAGIYRPIGKSRLTAGGGYFDIGLAGKGPLYGGDLSFTGNRFDCGDPIRTINVTTVGCS